MSIYVKALASGSSGNAFLLRAGPATVLFDAGLPGRCLPFWPLLFLPQGVVPRTGRIPFRSGGSGL